VTYAIRNSLIMIGVWIVMVGAGWSRFYWVEDAETASLDTTLSQKTVKLHEYQKVAKNYDNLTNQYQTLKTKVDEGAKQLVKARNADQVYSSLISLGKDSAFTYFNFITVDSTQYDKFGVLKFDVSGEGYYKNFNQFVNRLEYGRPLFKIRDMSIEPMTKLGNLGKVSYSFKLQSLYDRDSLFQDYSVEPQKALPLFTYNSFYPLIHDVKENTGDLLNVEKSKLVSVGENFISMRDQNGKIQYLYLGDRVYLGKLLSVDTHKNAATFELNRGGIIKYITRVLK